MDEVFLTINSQRQYVRCAVDQGRDVVGILVQSRRKNRPAFFS